MEVVNKSKHPTGRVMELLEKATVGIDTTSVAVVVTDAPWKYAGRAYDRSRLSEKTFGGLKRTNTYGVLVRIGGASDFPACNMRSRETRKFLMTRVPHGDPTFRQAVRANWDSIRAGYTIGNGRVDSYKNLTYKFLGMRDTQFESLYRVYDEFDSPEALFAFLEEKHPTALMSLIEERVTWTPYGGKKSTRIDYNTWEEAFVAVAAHEFKHIEQFRGNSATVQQNRRYLQNSQRSWTHRGWEAEAEHHAAAVLEAFRKSAETVDEEASRLMVEDLAGAIKANKRCLTCRYCRSAVDTLKYKDHLVNRHGKRV